MGPSPYGIFFPKFLRTLFFVTPQRGLLLGDDGVVVVIRPIMYTYSMSYSLRQSIRDRKPTPTSGSEESTVQIDVERMEMDEDGVSLRVYDCAGQVTFACWRGFRAGVSRM